MAHQKRSDTMKKQREDLRASITEKECMSCKDTMPVSMFCRKSASLDGDRRKLKYMTGFVNLNTYLILIFFFQ